MAITIKPKASKSAGPTNPETLSPADGSNQQPEASAVPQEPPRRKRQKKAAHVSLDDSKSTTILQPSEEAIQPSAPQSAGLQTEANNVNAEPMAGSAGPVGEKASSKETVSFPIRLAPSLMKSIEAAAAHRTITKTAWITYALSKAIDDGV